MKTISVLTDELHAVLDAYEPDLDVDDTILEIEIRSAIGAINRCRRFKPSGEVLYDETYEDKIIPLAITGYLKAGAEGETSHSENNVTRQYGNGGKYPKEMLADIVPLARFK